MFNQYFNALTRRPLILLALIATACLAASAGLSKLTYSSDFRVYFSDDNQRMQTFQEMEKRFVRQDNLIFLVSSEQEEIFSERGLQLIETLTHKSWEVAHVQRVDSIQNFTNTVVDGDELNIGEFYTMSELSITPAELKQRALDKPELLRNLVSVDGEVTGLRLLLNLPGDGSLTASQEAVDSAQALLSRMRVEYPEFTLEMGGSAYINTTMNQVSNDDMSRLLPLCHDVVLQNVEIEFELDEASGAVDIRAITKTVGPTGVEMEALTAVTVAALTVYDMCKSVTKEIEITAVRLLAKSGGRSGDYRRPSGPRNN